MRLRPLVLAVLMLMPTALLLGQEEEKPTLEKATPALSIGSDAPPLTLSSTVKGQAPTAFEKGTTYVLDFWATWCGPCVRAIPHMTELQAQYEDGDVQVIGVSIWESKPSGVADWVAGKGDEMGYTVVMDQVPPRPGGIAEGSREAQRWAVDNGGMSKNWMAAAGRRGIPSVFIVDSKGKLAWMGHPTDPKRPMADALEKIVAGNWDLDEAKREYEKSLEEAKRAREKRIKEGAVARQLFDLVREREFDKAIELAREKMDTNLWSNWRALNITAWTIVDPEGGVENKDLELAMKAARRADELTEGKNGAIIDTLARVYFLKGNVTRAIELQKKAIECSANEEMRVELENALAEYQKATPRKKKPPVIR